MPAAFEDVSVRDRFTELRQELNAQVERPQGEDPRIAAFFDGLRGVLVSEGIDVIFEEALRERPDLGGIHAPGLARAAIQKLALRRNDPDFPADYVEGEDYAVLIHDLLADPANREEFRQDILTRNVQTNVADRGKGPKLLMQYYQERFGGRPVNILDVGCARNHILKKMVLSERYPALGYGHVTVMDSVRGGELTTRFNKALAAGRLAIGRGVGIDKDTLDRPGEAEWSASSFYPTELLDPRIRRIYRRIDRAQLSTVDFRQVDVLDLAASGRSITEVLQGFTPDFVVISAMQYQLNRAERPLVRDLIRRSVNPDGVIMNLDFAQVDPEDRSSLRFFRHWDALTFRLVVEDMREPGNLQEVIQWQSGRCEQAVLGNGRLLVGNEHRTIEELLIGEPSWSVS